MKKQFLAASALLAFATTVASAQITPMGTVLANPPAGVTFSGAGIPGPVSRTVISGAGNVSRGPILILGASQRFDNAALTNNGAGTYYAAAGNDASSSPVAGYAQWQFNFYVGGDNVSAYNYQLFYDFDPADGNSLASHGVIGFPATIFSTDCAATAVGNPGLGLTCGANANVQNSWNLGMAFLNAGPTQPSFASFDPNAAGTYTFRIDAIDATCRTAVCTPAGSVAIAVSTVPEPSTYALMAAGLAALGLVARRRRNNA